jgi:diacylglycerol kinase family enzyme
LGSVNGRYFLFHTGAGFDAEVVAQVEKRGPLKRYAGHPLFVWAGFTTYFRHYDHGKPRFSVRHEPGGEVVDDGYLTVIQNTNPYTYLGSRPLCTAPDATLDQPLTAVTYRSLDPVTLLRSVVVALRKRSSGLGRIGKIAYRHHLDEVVITGYGPFPYQVDGDYLGEIEHLVFRHEPDILRLVLP